MKASEIVESIKEVLGMELAEVKVELEERKLENGTRIEADSFEKGKSVFILTDDEKVAMPVGEYLFEDGTLLVVEEEGVIADVREDVDNEVPQKEEAEKEEMNEEEQMDEEDDMMKDMMGRIQNLEDAIADLKSDKESKNSKEDEMYSKEEKVEASKEEKVELNKLEVSADPISHNPEKEVKKERVKLGNNRPMTTKEKIIQIINNN